jgi:hypothetical protein
LPCKKCEQEATLAERKRQTEFELQQKRELQQAEHEQRLKDLEEKIEAEVQIIKDAHLAQQHAQLLRQKQDDLNAAQSYAASFLSFLPIFSTSSTVQPSQAGSHGPGDAPPGKPNSKVTPESPHQPRSQPSPPHSPSRSRPQTPPGNSATSRKSSPEVEWQRQKDVEGTSCTAIDAVMGMIGLEDVKRQMLRIKDKIEVTQRQNTSIEDERFNIVFLGNPGTGRTCEFCVSALNNIRPSKEKLQLLIIMPNS